MVNELKQDLILEVERLVKLMYIGYPVDFCDVIDQIYYIKSLK